jgi:hypothetical protein
MVTRCRCTECRKRFEAATTTGKRQRTCSKECRLERRRKQAKRRRLADLESYRAEECERQQMRRDPLVQPGSDGKCHGPTSSAKALELLPKIRQIVDKALRVSRTDFGRQLRRIERVLQPIVFAKAAANGP